MIRRINLLGGPGSGKSTIAARMYAKMKQKHQSVELVREYVKEWAYEGRSITPYDQHYFFGKQMRKELVVLNANVQYIITDSPLILQIMYAERAGLSDNSVSAMLVMLQEYEKDFPSVNIMLDRRDKPYVESGRYETYEQAVKMDRRIMENCIDWKIDFKEIPYNDIEALYFYIKEKTVEA